PAARAWVRVVPPLAARVVLTISAIGQTTRAVAGLLSLSFPTMLPFTPLAMPPAVAGSPIRLLFAVKEPLRSLAVVPLPRTLPATIVFRRTKVPRAWIAASPDPLLSLSARLFTIVVLTRVVLELAWAEIPAPFFCELLPEMVESRTVAIPPTSLNR